MSLHPFQERSLLSLILKIYPLFHLIYPSKITYRLPLMISYLPIFQLLNNSGQCSFTCCCSFFGYQQWVAEGHPSNISRLGLFSSWLYCSSFMVRCSTFPIVTTKYLFVCHWLVWWPSPWLFVWPFIYLISWYSCKHNSPCSTTRPPWCSSWARLCFWPVSSWGHLPSWLYSS